MKASSTYSLSFPPWWIPCKEPSLRLCKTLTQVTSLEYTHHPRTLVSFADFAFSIAKNTTSVLFVTSASMTTMITNTMMKPKNDVTLLLRQVIPFTGRAPTVG
jgi:hypothetical protein